MGRFYWSVFAIFTAMAVHLAYVLFAPPWLFANHSDLRSENATVNSIDILSDDRRYALLPTLRGDGIAAICNADLSAGDVRIEMQLPKSYWSLAVYTRSGKQVYQLNDAQAETQTISVDLRYAKSIIQKILATGDEDEVLVVNDSAWSVELPDKKAFAVFWIPLADPLQRESVRTILGKSSCQSKRPA